MEENDACIRFPTLIGADAIAHDMETRGDSVLTPNLLTLPLGERVHLFYELEHMMMHRKSSPSHASGASNHAEC